MGHMGEAGPPLRFGGGPRPDMGGGGGGGGGFGGPDPRMRDPREEGGRFGGRDPRSRDPRGGGGRPQMAPPPEAAGSSTGLPPGLPPHLAGADPEKAQLIMQVLKLTDEQIALLPSDQRESIMHLKRQLHAPPQ